MSAFCGLVVFLISFLLVLGSAADAQTAHFSGANITLPIGAVTNPWGMAVDTNGNVYVADNAANSLSKLTPSGVLTSMSGEGSPYGVALDAAGNLYITDEVKNEVVKETPQQQGSYYSKSVLPLKGLNGPTGVAVDLHGNVYVADSGNNRVVKATPFGNTYTQSLVPGSPLSYPEGVAVDGSGNLYIADSHHFRVLKETPSGSNWSESVIANLENEGAPPIGVAADVAGDVFILDYLDDEDFSVFKETLSGGVYTLSNLRNVGPNPYGIAADAAGDVYLVSPGSNQLVKEFAGPATDFGIGSVKGAGISISLNFTFDTPGSVGSAALLTLGGEGLDFTDAGTGTCTTQSSSFVYNPGDTCSVDVVFQPRASGSRYGAVQLQNEYTQTFATTYLFGTGVAPQITFPPGKPVSITSYLENPSGVPAGFSGVAVDSQGSVFFAESGTGYVGKGYVPPVGSAGPIGFNTVAAGLSHPSGVALDGAGNVYITTPGVVYKAAPADRGGYAPAPIITDLADLVGIAVDRSANVYLTSSASGDVYKETLQADGSYLETSIGYGISSPKGVAVDGSGNLYILTTKSNHLTIETLQADRSYLQTTFALGLADPEELAVDGHGNLYVADTSHGEIDKLTPQMNGGFVETVVRAGLTELSGLAVDGLGNIYYSQANGGVTMIDVSDPPALTFATTKPGSTSTDSPKYQAIANIGNAPLVFPPSASFTNAALDGGGAFVWDGDSTCPIVAPSGAPESVAPGSSCVYGIGFRPSYPFPFAGAVILTDNNLNAAGSMQNIVLNGISVTSDATRTTMRVSPDPVTAGLGVTVIVTVTDTTNAATIPQGTVTVTDSVGGQVVSLNGGAAVALSNGKAVLTMMPTIAGGHTITAHYGGIDDQFSGSTGQASLTVQY